MTVSDLKSTFIFPEFFITKDNRIILIELNVRLGGFRSELYKYAYGLDLRLMAIKLALGQSIDLNKSKAKSSTAVEVWSNQSGTIKKLIVPDHPQMHYKKTFFNQSDYYQAAPIGDKPLAKFYIVSQSNSLSLAEKLKSLTKIIIE